MDQDQNMHNRKAIGYPRPSCSEIICPDKIITTFKQIARNCILSEASADPLMTISQLLIRKRGYEVPIESGIMFLDESTFDI